MGRGLEHLVLLFMLDVLRKNIAQHTRSDTHTHALLQIHSGRHERPLTDS